MFFFGRLMMYLQKAHGLVVVFQSLHIEMEKFELVPSALLNILLCGCLVCVHSREFRTLLFPPIDVECIYIIIAVDVKFGIR